MSKQRKELQRVWERISPINAKIVLACEHVERAGRAVARKEVLGVDFAYVDACLAKAISILASARAIAITEGNLSDPAFDDGDTWDWDEEVGLPEDVAGDVVKGGRS